MKTTPRKKNIPILRHSVLPSSGDYFGCFGIKGNVSSFLSFWGTKLQANLKIECRSNFLWKLSMARFYNAQASNCDCLVQPGAGMAPMWGSGKGVLEIWSKLKIDNWLKIRSPLCRSNIYGLFYGWCWMIKIVELCCEWFFGWFWENIG